VRARADLLATLQRDELERTGAELAKEYNLPFHMAEAGEQVQGKFTGTVQLASGKFAMMGNAFEFQLVPWRPVIDEHLGREITGVIRDGRHRVEDRPRARTWTLTVRPTLSAGSSSRSPSRRKVVRRTKSVVVCILATRSRNFWRPFLSGSLPATDDARCRTRPHAVLAWMR
jgi:Protein of unknown function (DUF3363)